MPDPNLLDFLSEKAEEYADSAFSTYTTADANARYQPTAAEPAPAGTPTSTVISDPRATVPFTVTPVMAVAGGLGLVAILFLFVRR